MEKKQKREEKKARREAKKEAKKARWEILVADLAHLKEENARLSSKLERLNGAVSDHINVSYPKMLENISSILNEEPEEPDEAVSAYKEGDVEREEEDRIEKIVENWDNEELVKVFWEFVNDQGIEPDFMDYARNVAQTQDK